MKFFFIPIITGAIVLGSLNILDSLTWSEIQSASAEVANTRVINTKAVLTPSDTEYISGYHPVSGTTNPKNTPPVYSFGNPAGCSLSAPNPDPAEMLAKVQQDFGSEIDLNAIRKTYTWNGPLGTKLNTINDPFVYEFDIKIYHYPLTYKADRLVTSFLTNGFVVWLRDNGSGLHLIAIPMIPGVLESPWAEYVTAYWQVNGYPHDDTIIPMLKKLPCHWVIDQGYVRNETLQAMFNFDWNIPDYLTAGRQYLASNCQEANRISREEIGFWDASSMCGPLAWTIMKDANGFPYRIGDWYADASIFIHANPTWNGRPWLGFDPETYDVFSIKTPMPSYDFASNGNLHTGDILYSYSTLHDEHDDHFDHIFMVAGVDDNGARISISNMVQNFPVSDCFISEVTLYTPGDLTNGVINKEWNGSGYGHTGENGFDIFRWKWQTYHLEGQARTYTVRTGETIETIAFDWKISPQILATANNIAVSDMLLPGQTIILPPPPSGYK